MGASGYMNAGMGVMSLAAGISEASNKKAQGKIQQQIAETNARFAEINAKDALERGAQEANDYGAGVRRVIADQRVAFASQGVEVDSGTAAQIQQDTEIVGGQNARTIKGNAWKEAWGMKTQAAGYRSAGAFASLQASNEARNSLITGGMRAAEFGVKAYGDYDKKRTLDEEEKKKKGTK